jgi:hypothetical protein
VMKSKFAQRQPPLHGVVQGRERSSMEKVSAARKCRQACGGAGKPAMRTVFIFHNYPGSALAGCLLQSVSAQNEAGMNLPWQSFYVLETTRTDAFGNGKVTVKMIRLYKCARPLKTSTGVRPRWPKYNSPAWPLTVGLGKPEIFAWEIFLAAHSSVSA